MNKTDLMLAFGSFSAGIAVGHYLFGENGLLREMPIIKNKNSTTKENGSKQCQIAASAEESKPEIAEALFFPDEGFACDDYFYNPKGCPKKEDDCRFSHKHTSLWKMCMYLRNAKKSIDVCVFSLGNYQLVQSLLYALDRGITVRLLIDHSMMESAEKQLMKLGPKGALIQAAKSNYLMHNKFAVIDKQIAMTGSLNWTMQGSNGNYENVAVIGNKNMVSQYAAKFEELWEAFYDLNMPKHPAVNCPENRFNPLKKAAWEGIIVGFEPHEAPAVDNYNSCGNRMPEPRRRRC